MSFTKRVMAALAVLTVFCGVQVQAAQGWQGWSNDLFEKAQASKRFVILDLEAVWCHWCHVMEEKTYGDEKVRALLEKKYIPVRVDQDENLALSSRYGDWGWPATIIFAPDGTEIVKLRGYIPAPRMAAILQAVIDDPTPGPSVLRNDDVVASTTPFLEEGTRKNLLENYNAVWDEKYAGWGQAQKFIHTESLDYALKRAIDGDETAARKAKRTLDAALNLIDREWGGVYQYSDQRDWRSPHFEKIMWYQAQYLRQYALAYALWKDERYREAARDIERYLTTIMLSGDGAFYSSQDADLSREIDGKTFYALPAEKRETLGMPRVDRNIYARDNGWAIAGLVAHANAFGDARSLNLAVRAACWIVANRQIEGGGFAHGENDTGGPYLADTLAMGEAMLALYAATGDREWLAKADRAGSFIAKAFRGEQAGYVTSKTSLAKTGVFARPVRQVEENIQLARFANALHRYTGRDGHRDMAVHAMKHLTSDQITLMRRFLIGVVLADDELSREPVHITIVGSKKDASAIALYKEARRYPGIYKRVDWYDRAEGPMLNADIEYPELEQAAAFACGNRICSLPVFEPSGIGNAVERMARAETRSAGN